ncbi:hypothetical protein [Rathayibacter toxicus]|uniref:Cell division protein FtsL n=1 Tax=Rathayibacter toxicus TaxID=145458 RepID=A0A2S5Y6R4_9MICO|nr:hypothetical protein [Rathayibacter toxicus]ALS56621.1 hypothetical protein APU90_01505 [Rathayibacter toxicus]PPG21549.1 hypothetical protein C5D15_04750 [Rathayibacter toxicus]PPG46513.1 hypothetical protein C5D16_04735 [Rathayibacter toxicus]PPH23590.1 hypothetical protein C5D17_04740 [Rathayibacter toxicus]PPH57395.1 hypothetical protein C5D30_04760 [Rathayibacter toxicus]
MSATAIIDPAVTDTARRARAEQPLPRPHIEAVPAPQRQSRSKLVFGSVAVVGLFTIIVIQLLVSVSLSQGAYQISGLQTEQKTLLRSNAEKQDAVDVLSSPQNLAMAAQKLGMVSNSAPVYLRLSDGSVLGDPRSASASEVGMNGAAGLVPNAFVDSAAPVGGPASASSTPSSSIAVPWQGELPAPITH